MAKSLAGNLFRCAVEAGDAEAVDGLLRDDHADIHVNDMIFLHQGSRYTSVERSARLKEVAVTRVLVRHGADVTKRFPPYSTSRIMGGALYWAIMPLEREILNPELLDILLNAGSAADSSMLKRLCDLNDLNSVESILSSQAEVKIDCWVEKDLLLEIAKLSDSDDVTLRLFHLLSTLR